MPSVEEMQETCRRLLEELRRGGVEPHRLLEIETIVRLLVPHLTRVLADAVLDGRAARMNGARADLAELRAALEMIGSRRRFLTPAETHTKLTNAAASAMRVLVDLDRE